jgi:ACS family hexuronate transporter-like MFS transporter
VAQLETTIESADAVAVQARPTNRWAWGICWLMFASTVLNYMDRQSMALVGPQIRDEFHLSNTEFGKVLMAFALTYAVFQLVAGYLVDRWNVRWAYAGAVAWWSLAGMAAAYSPSLAVLMLLRALLGVGESFNWPCALRVTGSILPPADRSLGNGIFNSGAAVGAVLTPLIVTLLTARYGWRTAFLVIGGLGFVWVVAWLALTGGAHRHHFQARTASGLALEARLVFGAVLVAALVVACWSARIRISVLELQLDANQMLWGIAVLMHGLLLAALVLPQRSLQGADWARSLGEMVRLPRFWILVLVSTTINICWHFQVNWLPSYLNQDRKLTGLVALMQRLLNVFHRQGDAKYLASGLLSAVPFLAADLGNLGGGALSRWFAGRGMTPVRARMVVMIVCTLLIGSGALVGWVVSDLVVVVLLGLMAMGTAAFMANYFAFTQEVSTRHTGLVVGFLGGLGNLYAGGFLPVAGRVKDTTGSFAPFFLLVGLIPVVGLIALVTGWRGQPGEAKSS